MAAMVKLIITLFVVSILLCCSSSSNAARPGPATSSVPTSYVGSEGHTFDPLVDRLDPASFVVTSSHTAVEGHDSDEQDLCVGLGEEDCLNRRTLAAHLDYIYTQKLDNP
ncbi:Phytosulfokines 3 [Linum grandiflorum]